MSYQHEIVRVIFYWRALYIATPARCCTYCHNEMSNATQDAFTAALLLLLLAVL